MPRPSLSLNNSNALEDPSKKHFGATLEVKLAFNKHLKNVLKKLTKQ